MRSRSSFLVALMLAVASSPALASAAPAPVGPPSAVSRAAASRAVLPAPPDVHPTPAEAAQAEEAGRQARARPAPRQAGAAAGPATVATARVFATQYNPNTPGSAEVAVPDQCAKFAALGNASVLASKGCPPGYALGLDYRLVVARDSGQSAAFPVRDVGPWNTDDNYWDFGPGASRPRRLFTSLPPGTPEAQAAFSSGFNSIPNCKNLDGTPSGRAGGADQFGRCVLNPAGVDLSFAAAAQLGLAPGQNEWVTVAFLWEPLRSNVVSVNSGKLADVGGASLADGASVIQWPANGGRNQQWRFEPVGTGVYRIVCVNSGKVLDVSGASTADGAPIIQWPWHGGANQQWRVEPVSEGVFRIVSVSSGKVLDVYGASTANGAQLIQWPSHGGANQQWRLPVVGTS